MTQVADVYSNRYEVERSIARGGMADVFLARDQYLDRPVAVKVLFPEFARDQAFVERFRREAQSAAMLNHPSIVNIYDYGQERGTYYIVMEYVEGRSLREVIKTDGPLPAMTVARLGAEIASALDFAHHHGVVHRDVKPGNVMITPNGQVKVTDFGIAAVPHDAKQGLTQTGSVIGTANYFSPEQAQGYQVDGRTDVYALGVVMYELLTGQAPFSADSPVAVAMKHVREQPVPPSQYVPDIPPDLERIVLTAMAKDLSARYQSAGDLRADLINFGRGQAVNAPTMAAMAAAPDAAPTMLAEQPAMAPATDHGQVWDEEPRRRWAPVIATILGLGLLAGVIGFALLAGGKKDEKSVTRAEVPDLVGQTFANAKIELEKRGFKVGRRDVVSDQPIDTVVEQRPEAGRLYPKGRTVLLSVSSNEVTVPNLVGQTFEQAESALARLNLVAVKQEIDAPDKAPGTVLATVPKAGDKVAKGSKVTVQVAKAPAVQVPDVAGKDAATAQQILTTAGFQVVIAPTPHNSVPANIAIGTDPVAGTKLPPDSPVTLKISTGPAATPVPNVVGKQCGAGASELTGAGFNVAVSGTPGNPASTVTSQNPSGGTAPPGSTVSITCSL